MTIDELLNEGWIEMISPPTGEQLKTMPVMGQVAGIWTVYDAGINQVKHDLQRNKWFIKEKSADDFEDSSAL